MTDLTALRDLERRLEQATGADRALDLALGALWPDPPFSMSVNQQRGGKPPVFSFTASLDAAVALTERTFAWTICRPVTGIRASAVVSCEFGRFHAQCENAAISTCLATIRALIAQNESGGS